MECNLRQEKFGGIDIEESRINGLEFLRKLRNISGTDKQRASRLEV